MTDAIRDAVHLRRSGVPAWVATEDRSPRLRRVTVQGHELVGLDPPPPAASVRLLLPRHGELVLPQWNGNELLDADGSRPHLRTVTPLRIDPDRGEVEVDIVLHGSGPMATWASSAVPGDPVAISGTGRGYAISNAPHHLLAGDESALPAIATILAEMPDEARATVLVEIAQPDATVELSGPDGCEVAWHVLPTGAPPGDALVAAVEAAVIEPDARVWAAGEAAAVQRIRRHLFESIQLPRGQCTVRGYWKHGRAGEVGGR